MTTEEFDSLLFPLFDYLRINDVPIGVSEYLLAIKLVCDGILLNDIERFKLTCKLIWTKSLEDQELFDTGFAKYIEPKLQSQDIKKSDNKNEIQKLDSSITNSNSGSTPTTTPSTETTNQRPITNKTLEKQESQKAYPSFSSMHLNQNQHSKKIEDSKYQLIPRLHLTEREMVASWRQLRHLKREGILKDLNIEATINKICEVGVFLKPVLQPHRRNQAKLVVLIDKKGSMSPFSLLIDMLVKSLLRSGSLSKVSFYYFHDCPTSFLYKNVELTSYITTKDALANSKDSSVLIVSDAGAAHGDYDEQRLEDTKFFLRQLNKTTYLYAWLNPLPIHRWQSSTAEDIKQLVPMFSLDREGLNDAINILRGQPFPIGVSIE